MNLQEQIDQKIGEVRTEPVDLSYGEIANLRKSNELIIQPEYQRLFRWEDQQKSRLIESILLELPIPQIFVMENADGVYELIDGLQRISSVLQFMEPAVVNKPPFELTGCDIIDELNGLTYDALPTSLKLRLKRSTQRTIVIKRQSKSFLRYEMFKRLNTGGSLLSQQEIRNCSARMLGDNGAAFYGFLKELAQFGPFQLVTSTLPPEELEKKADEELVLRFFATKESRATFRGSVRDWLDGFMEAVLLDEVKFDPAAEREEFIRLFTEVSQKLGETAFVKYRDGRPIGGLAPAYFESISIGCLQAFDALQQKTSEQIRGAITQLVQSRAFRDVTGPGANSKTKLEARINLATDAIVAA